MSQGFNQVLRRTVTAACLCEPEAFETGVIRGATLKYNDSAALRLRRRALIKWRPGAPSKVLIVKKPKTPAASAKLQEIGAFLRDRGIEVFVERVVWATEFKEFSVFDPRVHRQDIDFCITLGGDGTVLYMTSLFEEDEPLPPVLCFSMGSLGFLTPFDAAHYESTLTRVLDTATQPLFCTLRTRKRCEVVYDGQLEAVHHVLNECVLDRGAFPGTVLLEIFVDGSYVTNVEADGLIISTPSGSTAYSMSAGGPMVAPSVPCTVFTPLAPLSLSFRPVVIPESSSICVHLPTCARSHARASFDGKKPMRIRRGTSLFFTTSLCPLPVISLGRMDTDWYEGITSKLKWNQAIRKLPSCPSFVGAQQQELCSARYADRTAAEAAAATEGCPVDGAEPFGNTVAAVAAASAALRVPSGYLPSGGSSNGGSANGSGYGSRTDNGSGHSGNGNGNGHSAGGAGGNGASAASSSLDFAFGQTPHRNLNGNGNGANGNGANGNGSHHSYTTDATALAVPDVSTVVLSNGNGTKYRANDGSNDTSCSGACTPDDLASITDSMTNSLEDPDEAAAAAAAAAQTRHVATVAAAAVTAASTPLRPSGGRTRPHKGTSHQRHQRDGAAGPRHQHQQGSGGNPQGSHSQQQQQQDQQRQPPQSRQPNQRAGQAAAESGGLRRSSGSGTGSVGVVQSMLAKNGGGTASGGSSGAGGRETPGDSRGGRRKGSSDGGQSRSRPLS